MPEAVIVDAIRTPIGRAVKGSLKTVRADDLAAIPLKALIERNPQLEQTSIGDVMMGCGYGEGESGLQHRAHRRAAGGHRPPRAGHAPSTASAPPRCRRRGWPSTRSRPARATPTSPPASRPSRAPGRGSQFEFNHAARRLGGLALQRLHPDGHDRRERRRELQRQPRGPGRVGADLPDARGGGRRSPGTSTRRSSR